MRSWILEDLKPVWTLPSILVEICGGSGVVSLQAAKLGLTVCPPIELSDSRHFNLQSPRLLEWICYMLSRNLFKSIMLEPPCTSFSAAAHPCVRSYRQPLGFCRENPKVHLGNMLAFRCFSIMLCAYHHTRPNLLEQPFSFEDGLVYPFGPF